MSNSKKINSEQLALGEPRYVKVASQLRGLVRRGVVKPGERLPSFPEMKARHGVSQWTMERAHAILEEEGLIERRRGLGTFVLPPQRSARSQMGVIGIAGIVVWASQQIPYYLHLMQGFQQAAAEAGYEMLLLNEDSQVRWDKLDGVVGVLEEHELQRLPALMPRVSVLVENEGTAAVVADDGDGVRQAVEHLIALGHRRIALLMSSPAGGQLRAAAYRQTLRAAGIEAQASWTREIEVFGLPQLGYREWGHAGMTQWLREDWSTLDCTALLAQNDTTAIGAMQALQEAGLRVPHDVSVIGFDGTEICDCLIPRLSSVEVPLREIGALAVKVLLEQTQNADMTPQTIRLATRLQVRQSTAAPRL